MELYVCQTRLLQAYFDLCSIYLNITLSWLLFHLCLFLSHISNKEGHTKYHTELERFFEI